MADKKPLVLDGADLEQLQAGDDIDAPVTEQLRDLRRKFRVLLFHMLSQGFDLPDELVEESQAPEEE